VSGNILNSNGTHVAVANGGEVSDLDGQKIYELKRDQPLSAVRRVGPASKQRARHREAARSLCRQVVPCQREISPNLIATVCFSRLGLTLHGSTALCLAADVVVLPSHTRHRHRQHATTCRQHYP
jgi:hypothetical protein